MNPKEKQTIREFIDAVNNIEVKTLGTTDRIMVDGMQEMQEKRAKLEEMIK